MTTFPTLNDLHDLTAVVPQYHTEAMACIRYEADGSMGVRYPWLGLPYPHQPKVCKAVKRGTLVCCGVGGHTSKTHNLGVSIATRALGQAVWLLENMDLMAREEVVKQIAAMLHVLCALEVRRQEQRKDGFPGATSEIKSILVMYTTVTDVWATVADSSSSLTSTTRNFRSTTQVLNTALPPLVMAPPDIPSDVYAEVVGVSKRFAVFLFPGTTGNPSASPSLHQLCDTAFREAAPAFLNGGGHAAKRVPAVPSLFSACAQCGLVGHNKGSCLRRSTATHIATALATMIDPCKMSRLTVQAGHMCLFSCYRVLVTLLYKWWSKEDVDWTVRGLSRLALVGENTPLLLLRFFNYIVAHLKQHARFGQDMVVVRDEDHLSLDAAHLYEDGKKSRPCPPEAVALKRKARSIAEAAHDDDLCIGYEYEYEYESEYEPEPQPTAATTTPRRQRMRDMIVRSASVNPRLAREEDIGRRFGFEDLVF